MDLKKNDLVQVRSKLKESVSLIKRVLGSVRNLVFDLGPAVWNEQGFIPAVRTHARQFSARTGIKVHFETRRLHVPLPARYESALYKVIQGALANVAAHADACHVKISLAISRTCVVMKIEDDGKGFNVDAKLRTAAHSYGLRAMRDRIELLGGKIQFTSQMVQQGVERSGTMIRCDLPLEQGVGRMKNKNCHLLLCDDHTLFREGIKAILRDVPSLEIVGEAEDGRQAQVTWRTNWL